MRISQKLQQAHESGSAPTFSFEYFVPKTSAGLINLYDRMDRMYEYGPQFIDITWNAGGSNTAKVTPKNSKDCNGIIKNESNGIINGNINTNTKPNTKPKTGNLTTEMVGTAQSIIGLETCMHLTCVGMTRSQIDDALNEAYAAGCQNILALRGDLPVNPVESVENGSEADSSEKDTNNEHKTDKEEFRYAVDLIKYIRKKYGDYFDIGVAAYPEGHPEEKDQKVLTSILKEKIEAGGNFVITQMFYDADRYIQWVNECRSADINVPLIPGIMPISTYASFIRRAKWCNIHVPKEFMQKVEAVKDDDAQVREIGTKLVADMCRKILDNTDNKHLHFYTMNLERATRMVLEDLNLIGVHKSQSNFPWRASLALNRREESVRPIFWKNRTQSYINRTRDWDEFPNGRWGDARSPAYGEIDLYGSGIHISGKQNPTEIWGSPTSIRDLGDLFARYLLDEVKCLPWSDGPITAEIDSIRSHLVSLNRRGLLTINSQPAVNAAPSNHPVHGWGPQNGRVYQKAYLELLLPPHIVEVVIDRINKLNAKTPDMFTYYNVNCFTGDLRTNCPGTDEAPIAVTWGVFPGKEILQPTVVESVSFLAWKDEAYRLGMEWARLYSAQNPARKFIENIMSTYSMINIVHNDFMNPFGIFDLFDDISLVKD